MSKTFVKVLFDFDAQTEQELSVKANDELELLADYGDGWAECALNNKHGLVPVTFFETIDKSTSRKSALIARPVIATVTVDIIEAHDLEVKDLLSSDPFVVVRIGSQEQKTKVVRKCLNPKFNEKFTFRLPSADVANGILSLKVWDHDLITKSDFMGSYTLALSSLDPEVPLKTWVELEDAKSVVILELIVQAPKGSSLDENDSMRVTVPQPINHRSNKHRCSTETLRKQF